MIAFRAHTLMPITALSSTNLSPGHPLAAAECPVCDRPLGTEEITMVLVGFEPSQRQGENAGNGWRRGSAVPVHTACTVPPLDPQTWEPPKAAAYADGR